MRKVVAAFVWALLALAWQPHAVAGTIGATSATPTSVPTGVPVDVIVTSLITDATVIPSTVNLQRLDSSGRVLGVIGSLHDDGRDGDAVAGDNVYTISTTILENVPGTVILRTSAGFQGTALRAFSAPFNISVVGTPTGIGFVSPANGAYVNISPVTVNGTVGDPAARVNVNGVTAPVSGGSFVATVPLNEGPNTLTAVAANSNGQSSTASIQVTLDTTAPHVLIYSPLANSVTTDSTVTVTGLVNDIVVGTVNPEQARVTVNGVPAQVLNRSFNAPNIPLALGPNTIAVSAVDRAGNGATTSVLITRQALTATTLRLASGSGQTGPIRSKLASPLVAQLVNASGAPLANTPVVFRVLTQDGSLAAVGATAPGSSSVIVSTDANGLATASLTLGSRAGAGNNLVEASATGVATTATFVASATPLPPAIVVIDSGNNQTGVIGQPLPFPFIAIVTDNGYNRLAGVPVTFTVKKGGGNFAGKSSLVATSDSDGRVSATLALGTDTAVNANLVEVSFPNNAGFPAAFVATGLVPGPESLTSISGVVLDNANAPIPGVTMRLFRITQGNVGNIPQQVAQPVQTNAQGQFLMHPVPAGVFKLMADGGTAQRPGSWPTLEYDMVTVPGEDNTVGLPIYLPQLNTNSTLCVSSTTGGTLTLPQAPGFALTIAAGSATFPGGSRTGCVSVTPVNMDKVPMAPGFGQQPRFIVSIQPAGTRFDPPAAMTIPNVDGLAPRAVTEMYSYDHDLASFVAIGTGTVSDDGSVIKSDPGVGVLKAGWHCGGNPNTTGSAGTCPECQKCQGNSCTVDSSANGNACTLNGAACGTCQNGVCKPPQITNVKPLADGKDPGAKGVNEPVNFTVTFDQNPPCPSGVEFHWDFGDGGTSDQQSPSHTYVSTGTFTATVRVQCKNCTQSSGQGQVKVTVVKIVKDKLLWYFNGENPPVTGGGISITLTAEGASQGQFKWDVVAGTDKVTFENNSGSITKTDVNTVVVKSLKASAAMGDVSIKLTLNGVGVPAFPLEVRAPKRLRATNNSDDGRGASCSVGGTEGYQSLIGYDILNQFDEVIQNAGINEKFGAKTNNETNNWPIPTEGGFAAPSGNFADAMCITTTAFNPNPLPPQSPRSGRQIDKIVQKWFAGSTTPGGVGVQVQTDDFTRFIDHGRHNSITSP